MAWHANAYATVPPSSSASKADLVPVWTQTKLIESHHPHLGEKADLASEDILSCGGPDTISNTNTNTNTTPHPHLGEKADLCSDDV